MYGFSVQEMGRFVGIAPIYYERYEKEGEIPSKYIYRLWLKIKGFPIPDDFFWYTSFTLIVNMKYHKLTQTQIARMFDIQNQSTISSLLSDNIPMYELKEYFHQFEPLIIPMQAEFDCGKDNAERHEIQELKPKGNFISVRKKREARKRSSSQNTAC